jgi:hypothetical protein
MYSVATLDILSEGLGLWYLKAVLCTDALSVLDIG